MASLQVLNLFALIAISCLTEVKSDCCSTEPITNPFTLPKNCREIQLKGGKLNGVYTIYPFSWTQPVNVYCDLNTDNGGWIVFQRRKDGSVDFFRTWAEYKDGFGSPDGETWLGNDIIHALTDYTAQEMRIDMEDWEGVKAHAHYGNFYVGSETEEYRLTIGDFLGGVGGDGMSGMPINNQKFTTKDNDNDAYINNCATRYPSGFWFSNCFYVNPNGIYQPSSATDGHAKGVIWRPWKDYYYSLKFTEMKMRPAL